MFTQYRIRPTVNQAQKDEMKPLIENMLKSDFVSQSSGEYSREFPPETFLGLKYAHTSYMNNWSHLKESEADRLVIFLNSQDLTCQKKVITSGCMNRTNIDNLIIFPGKNCKNEIIDALEKLFEQTNNPTIASNINKI